jgi:hypothetical protein
MSAEYLTPKIEDRAVELQRALAERGPDVTHVVSRRLDGRSRTAQRVAVAATG